MFSSSLSTSATAPRIVTLHIDINYYDGAFSYKYDKLELILPIKKEIVVRLSKSRTPPGAKIYICGFCTSDLKALPLLEPLKPDGSPYGVLEYFPETVQEVKFQFNAEPRQLVSFGVHVKCVFEDGSGKQHDYTELCDPQVGNGPPNSGNAAMTI
jgi:hypothetical protein